MLGQKLIKYVEQKGFSLPVFFFSLLKLKKIYKKPVVWLDQVQITGSHGIYPCVSHAPQVDEQGQSDELHHTQVNVAVYHFKNVLMNVRSSSFLRLDSDTLVLERLPEVPLEYCDYSAGFIRMHNENWALVRLNRKRTELKRVFFLGGNGCFNYYHWMIEIAPKILFLNKQILEKYPVDYIVCDAAIEHIASFRKILEAMLKVVNIDLPIVFADKYHELEVTEVLYISHLNNIVFNTKNTLSSVTYSHFSADLLKKIRGILMQSVNLSKSQYSRIFLARKECQARFYNQQEVLAYFMSQGFQPVYLEEYSFDEQISLFNQADFIVGPSGAAWSNLIFCKEGCQGISWLPERLSAFSAFSSLAEIFACELEFVLTDQAVDEDDIHSDYQVNVSALEGLYLKMTAG